MGVRMGGVTGLNTASLVERIITATSTNQDVVIIKNSTGNNNIILNSDASGRGVLQLAQASGTTTVQLSSAGTCYINLGDGLVVGTSAQLGSVILRVVSTTRGFLPPVMTTAQKNAIGSPATGLILYDSDLGKICVYTGAAWETVTSVYGGFVMELEGKNIVPIKINSTEVEISWNESKLIKKEELEKQIIATEKHLLEMKELIKEFE